MSFCVNLNCLCLRFSTVISCEILPPISAQTTVIFDSSNSTGKVKIRQTYFVMSCYRCREVTQDQIVVCNSCKLLFHAACINADVTKQETWMCLICPGSREVSTTETFIRSMYALVETSKDSPLGMALSILVKHTMKLESELTILRAEAGKSKKYEENFMDTSDGREKKILLIGNDLDKIKPCLEEVLPLDSVTTLALKGAEMKSIVREVKRKVEEDKESVQYSVFVHPSIDECALNQHLNLTSEAKFLTKQLKETSPDTELTFLSVPQVFPTICQAVNDDFAAMGESQEARYIPVTRVQSSLFVKGLRQYDAETAEHIAGIISKSCARFLGVKLKPRKASQQPREKEKEKPGKHGKRGGPGRNRNNARGGRANQPLPNAGSKQWSQQPLYVPEYLNSYQWRENPPNYAPTQFGAQTRAPNRNNMHFLQTQGRAMKRKDPGPSHPSKRMSHY